MKKFFLLAFSAAIFTSCATRKYGCGYTSNVDTSLHEAMQISYHTNKNGVLVADTAIVTKKYYNGRYITVDYCLKNNKPDLSVCRAYGKVFTYEPKYLLIKVGGILLRDDSVMTEVKYVLVPDGSNFHKSIKPYMDTNVDVYFETKMLFPNIFSGPEVRYATDGFVDHVEN